MLTYCSRMEHKVAIFSDIHSNNEALESCIEDAKKQNVKGFLSLGDLVGYGPEPRKIMKAAMGLFRFTLKGNHEEGVLNNPDNFNARAAASALWTRRQILSRFHTPTENESMWNFMKMTTPYLEEGEVLFVHASPNDPVWEYVMPEDSMNREVMESVFKRIRWIAFGGHTHIPGIFTRERFIYQGDLHGPVKLKKGEKYFINVGSVGQPRDQNPKASYVIFEGDSITFRRVQYNFRTTARKIARVKELPIGLAARLERGL